MVCPVDSGLAILHNHVTNSLNYLSSHVHQFSGESSPAASHTRGNLLLPGHTFFAFFPPSLLPFSLFSPSFPLFFSLSFLELGPHGVAQAGLKLKLQQSSCVTRAPGWLGLGVCPKHLPHPFVSSPLLAHSTLSIHLCRATAHLLSPPSFRSYQQVLPVSLPESAPLTLLCFPATVSQHTTCTFATSGVSRSRWVWGGSRAAVFTPSACSGACHREGLSNHPKTNEWSDSSQSGAHRTGDSLCVCVHGTGNQTQVYFRSALHLQPFSYLF